MREICSLIATRPSSSRKIRPSFGSAPGHKLAVDLDTFLLLKRPIRSVDIAFCKPLTLPNDQLIFEPGLRASSITQANRPWELASFDELRDLRASQTRVSGQIPLADQAEWATVGHRVFSNKSRYG
jgi:hypothetical protein